MTRERKILLVEDSAGDVELIRLGLERASFDVTLVVARDGVEALEMLRGSGSGGQVPDMVLLDINLPRKSGHEVLGEMKSDPLLRRIPVIMLSTSDRDDDVRKAYDSHANAYVTKPSNGLELLKTMELIQSFWLANVQFPNS